VNGWDALPNTDYRTQNTDKGQTISLRPFGRFVKQNFFRPARFLETAGFSLSRFALFCAIGAMGLLVGRTIGRWMFINRQSSKN
jgi:hypothetical protein